MAPHSLQVTEEEGPTLALQPSAAHRGRASLFSPAARHWPAARCLSKATFGSSPGRSRTSAPQSGHTMQPSASTPAPAPAAHPWEAACRCSRQNVPPHGPHRNGRKSRCPHPAASHRSPNPSRPRPPPPAAPMPVSPSVANPLEASPDSGAPNSPPGDLPRICLGPRASDLPGQTLQSRERQPPEKYPLSEALLNMGRGGEEEGKGSLSEPH